MREKAGINAEVSKTVRSCEGFLMSARVLPGLRAPRHSAVMEGAPNLVRSSSSSPAFLYFWAGRRALSSSLPRILTDAQGGGPWASLAL